MELKKTDRSALKSYFKAGAKPTAANFAELIDCLFHQKEDGLVKPPREPLSVQADGDANSQQKVFNFYGSFTDREAAWMLSLNPRRNPDDPGTAQAGWSIGDAKGVSKLFIDKNTGNVGIGTLGPEKSKLENKLDVMGDIALQNKHALRASDGFLRLNQDKAFEKGVHTPYLFSAGSLNVGAPGGSWGDPGAGNAWIKGKLGIGTAAAPKASLEVADGAIMPAWGKTATTGIQFPSDPGGGSGDAAWIRYYPRSGESCTLEIGISNDADDHIALMSENGNVGIGTLEPKTKLEVKGTAKADALQLGDKWRLSGVGDAHTRPPNNWGPEWLRLFNTKDTEYYGGFAAGKMWCNSGKFDGSDLRMKTDVSVLQRATQDIQRLRGVRFRWRDAGSDAPPAIGLIAQDVEAVFPEAVIVGPEGMKGVNYAALIAPLVEAVKEQQSQIDELRAQVRALQE